MKKILVSDYDQTFYLNDEDIEKNKTSVKKFRDKGNIFIFATGRSYMDFMKRMKRLMLVGFLFKQKILKFFSLNLKIMNILIY